MNLNRMNLKFDNMIKEPHCQCILKILHVDIFVIFVYLQRGKSKDNLFFLFLLTSSHSIENRILKSSTRMHCDIPLMRERGISQDTNLSEQITNEETPVDIPYDGKST